MNMFLVEKAKCKKPFQCHWNAGDDLQNVTMVTVKHPYAATWKNAETHAFPIGTVKGATGPKHFFQNNASRTRLNEKEQEVQRGKKPPSAGKWASTPQVRQQQSSGRSRSRIQVP